jgi:plastocyanin
MSQQTTPAGPLEGEVRFRVPLPVVIPVLSLLVIAAVTIGMSRILLAVPKEVAVIIACAVAANILITCAILANRPETARRTWPELLIVATYPLLVGALLAGMNIESTGHAGATEAEGHEAPAAGAEGGTTIAAASVAFDTSELQLTAGEETDVTFVNDDASSIQHNVSIYEEEGGKSLFEGETIPGGQEISYSIPALKKGEYYFQCDVHPGMNGSVIVQ